MDPLKKRLIECTTSLALSKNFAKEISLAEMHWSMGKTDDCAKVLQRIPTVESLTKELLGKLTGKRVHKTISLITEGKSVDRLSKMKALSSFYTHAVIECEQGRSEFEILLPQILENLTALTFGNIDGN